MLLLLFNAGPQRCAIPAARVVEVLPLLQITPLPGSPPALAGYFNYQGRPVSAIDLSALTCGRPAARLMSTRILLVRHPAAPPPDQFLGLIAEQATEIVKRPDSDLVDPGVRLPNAPHLGPVFMDDQGAVQCIYEDRLLIGPAHASSPERHILSAPASDPSL